MTGGRHRTSMLGDGAVPVSIETPITGIARREHLLRYRNTRGIGGFYESIMALMVVTVGMILLTTSFALLTVDRGQDDQGAEGRCEELMGKVLNDPTWAISDRFLDNRALSHLDVRSMISNWTGGVKLMLTFPDGTSKVLWESGGEAGPVRACLSEPVNIRYDQALVRAALLTIWVWP
jgi:hypothetical protein